MYASVKVEGREKICVETSRIHFDKSIYRINVYFLMDPDL